MEQELARLELLRAADAHEVLVGGDESVRVRVRVHGVKLLENHTRGTSVYLTEDGQVLGHEHKTGRLIAFDEPDRQLEPWLIQRDYLEVMAKLGLPARVETGARRNAATGVVSPAAPR